MEELKRQREVERMMEVVNKGKGGYAKVSDLAEGGNLTFDFEGGIIEVKRPDESKLPDTLTNPRIKFKKPMVESNLMEQIIKDRSLKAEQKKKGKRVEEDCEKSSLTGEDEMKETGRKFVKTGQELFD